MVAYSAVHRPDASALRSAEDGRTASWAELEDLVAFAGEQLARLQLPKRIVVVPDLPRNVTGKVNRDVLREQY